jgi:hypothetical protein
MTGPQGVTMLQWASSEESTKGPRDWYAPVADGEYRIRGPLQRSDPATRTVAEYYAISRGRAVSHTVGVVSEYVGEAQTLRQAKATAQHHHDAHGKA